MTMFKPSDNQVEAGDDNKTTITLIYTAGYSCSIDVRIRAVDVKGIQLVDDDER